MALGAKVKELFALIEIAVVPPFLVMPAIVKFPTTAIVGAVLAVTLRVTVDKFPPPIAVQFTVLSVPAALVVQFVLVEFHVKVLVANPKPVALPLLSR